MTNINSETKKEYKAYFNKKNADGLSYFLINENDILDNNYTQKSLALQIGDDVVCLPRFTYKLQHIQNKNDPRNKYYKLAVTPYVNFKDSAKHLRNYWIYNSETKVKQKVTLKAFFKNLAYLSKANNKQLKQFNKFADLLAEKNNQKAIEANKLKLLTAINQLNNNLKENKNDNIYHHKNIINENNLNKFEDPPPKKQNQFKPWRIENQHLNQIPESWKINDNKNEKINTETTSIYEVDDRDYEYEKWLQEQMDLIDKQYGIK